MKKIFSMESNMKEHTFEKNISAKKDVKNQNSNANEMIFSINLLIMSIKLKVLLEMKRNYL